MPTRLAVGLGPKRLPYAGFPVIRPMELGPPFPSTRTGFSRLQREDHRHSRPVVMAKHIYHFGKKENQYLPTPTGGGGLRQWFELDPAIVGLAFLGVVGIDRAALAVTSGGQPCSGDPLVLQELHHRLGAALGQVDVIDG